MKDRWQELLSNIMSVDKFNSRLDSYAKIFRESGAWQREYDKWNNNPVPLDLDVELEYVKEWYVKNIKALNEILGISSGIENITYPYIIDNSNYSIDGKQITTKTNFRGVYIFNGKKIFK